MSTPSLRPTSGRNRDPITVPENQGPPNWVKSQQKPKISHGLPRNSAFFRRNVIGVPTKKKKKKCDWWRMVAKKISPKKIQGPRESGHCAYDCMVYKGCDSLFRYFRRFGGGKRAEKRVHRTEHKTWIQLSEPEYRALRWPFQLPTLHLVHSTHFHRSAPITAA